MTHRKKVSVSFDINGKHYSNVSVEQKYKGNYHLLADINGKERKSIIGKNKPEYNDSVRRHLKPHRQAVKGNV